jgi:hypothetical protein
MTIEEKIERVEEILEELDREKFHYGMILEELLLELEE